MTPMRRSPFGARGDRLCSRRRGARRGTGDTRPIDLDESGARVPEHDEVADQGQEPGPLERPRDDGFELRRALRGDGGPVHGAPGHEPFEIGRQRAEARVEAVRGHEHGVRAEQGRYLVLVGLELVEGPFEGGVLVARVLQLNDGQWAGR